MKKFFDINYSYLNIKRDVLPGFDIGNTVEYAYEDSEDARGYVARIELRLTSKDLQQGDVKPSLNHEVAYQYEILNNNYISKKQAGEDSIELDFDLEESDLRLIEELPLVAIDTKPKFKIGNLVCEPEEKGDRFGCMIVLGIGWMAKELFDLFPFGDTVDSRPGWNYLLWYWHPEGMADIVGWFGEEQLEITEPSEWEF